MSEQIGNRGLEEVSDMNQPVDINRSSYSAMPLWLTTTVESFKICRFVHPTKLIHCHYQPSACIPTE